LVVAFAILSFQDGAFHPIGEAIWYEFGFTIESTRGTLHGRGMSLWRKSNGRWRMAGMHDTIERFGSAAE
jgi:hypothetical protein